MTTGTLGPGPKYQPILCISFTMVIFSREGEEMGIPHEISLVLGGWRIRHINTSGLGARTWTGRDPGRLSCFFSLALFLLFSSLSSSLLLLFLASARPLSLSSGPPLPATLCLSWPSRLSSPVALYPTPLIHRRLSSFFLLVLPPFPVVYSPQYLSHLPPPPLRCCTCRSPRPD